MTKLLKLLIILIIAISFNTAVYAADTTPPTSTLTSDPSSPNGENDWYTVYPNITISATDSESGVGAIYWKIDDGSWQISNFTEGLNLLQNPSFEEGYISNWNFEGPFFSLSFKTSSTHYTGNYSAMIVGISTGDSYWVNTNYVEAIPYKTYTYSFYDLSHTSRRDNGFYEIFLLDEAGEEQTILRVDDVDLKKDYVERSGQFTLGNVTGQLYMKMGISGMGHYSVDDAYLSMAGEDSSVEFTLSQEGTHTVYYYTEDAAGNTEATKQQTFKIDTNAPQFTNFQTSGSLQTFSSQVDVTDDVSTLVADPALFNYSVNPAMGNGYYEDYANCAGEFIGDDPDEADPYLDLSTSYITGNSTGTVSTPTIDYCDSNWVNCKKINFYVKDLAGNVGNHSICINGPYISSTNGDIYARNSIYQMGLGTNFNVTGAAVSGGAINDISSESEIFVENYEAPYLNTWYAKYYEILKDQTITVESIDNSEGIYVIEETHTISSGSAPSYDSVNQVVFIDGDLTIEENITSTSSNVFYFVNGTTTFNNNVTNVDVNIISTSEIFTANSSDLAEKITINGILVGQNLVFSRNTDRTLGPSEVINFPIHSYIQDHFLKINNIYWREVLE